jgi:hypothetical protein
VRAWLIVWLVAIAAPARAEPRVVLAETRDAPALPTLVSQVEIHAAGRATVELRAARDSDPLTYAEEASRLVAAGEATIVIWIARVDHGYLVFAAGRWPGRALLELVRVADTIDTAELERTIALKIAGLLDTLLAVEPSPRVALAIAPMPVPARVRPVRRWRLEVAGFAARDPSERGIDGRAAIAVASARTRGAWSIAPMVAGYYQPSGTIDGETGRASIRELGAALGVEGGRELRGIEAFGRARFALGALMASGESADGRAGSATVYAPYLGLDLGMRRRVSDSIWIGVLGGVEVAMIHHEFLVDAETVIDLGRARLHVGVTFAIGL